MTIGDVLNLKKLKTSEAWFVVSIAVLSALCPLAEAFCVVDLLVGAERLKRHYWIRDGIALSCLTNLMVWPPLCLSQDRLGWLLFGIVGLVLVNITAFCTYFLWMAALTA